jgi:hypothetical protein
MRKIAGILLAVFMLGLTLPALASPFSDLPADHWATKAVELLAEKGLVEGYPDGTFKGDRATTRYEVAMIVARLVAYLEKEKPQVTQQDLDAIRQLVNEYKDELDAMGVRMKNVEDTLADLQARVKKLEAIQVSGAFETRFYTGNVPSTNIGQPLTPFKFDALAEGSRLPQNQNATWEHVMLHNTDNDNVNNDVEGFPMDRVYTAVPTESGTALTGEGYLKVSAKISEDYTAGGVLGLYENQQDLGNGYTYGVNPPLLDNPVYNVNNVFPSTETFFIQNIQNINATLEQIFVTNPKENLNVVVGNWEPAYTPDFLLKGVPNPGVYGPDYLPFYGGQIWGKLSGTDTWGNGLYYEVFDGKLPSGSLDISAFRLLYNNMVFGADLSYHFNNPNASVTAGYVRVLNDTGSLPPNFQGGQDIPNLWQDPVTGFFILSSGVGPQTENLYGVQANIWALDWVNVWGKYGNSQYNPDHANSDFSNVGGSMWDAGVDLGTKGVGHVTGSADYLHVDPTYDPFVAELNLETIAFTGPIAFYAFPYPVSYYNPLFINPGIITPFAFKSMTLGAGDVFYNVHDARKYPDNRSGWRASVNWNYGSGNLGGHYENLTQTQASFYGTSFATGELQPGFYEPVFYTAPGLPSSSNPGKGTIKTWYGYFDYTIPGNSLTVNAIWGQSQIQRPELDDNNINLQNTWWKGGIVWRPNSDDSWQVLAGADQFYSNGAGQYLQAPNTPGAYLFKESGAYFGVDYNFAKNADAWIEYNIFDQKDNSNGVSIGTPGMPAAGFNGTSLSSGLRFLF